MKKMNEKDMRNTNGGRWKCGNCSYKSLTVGAMHMHLFAVHQACKIFKGGTFKDMNSRWRYKWCP